MLSASPPLKRLPLRSEGSDVPSTQISELYYLTGISMPG